MEDRKIGISHGAASSTYVDLFSDFLKCLERSIGSIFISLSGRYSLIGSPHASTHSPSSIHPSPLQIPNRVCMLVDWLCPKYLRDRKVRCV